MPNEIAGVFVWVVGLSVGSFLNVVIYRLPRDLSIAEPRWSFCPACRHQLAWHDNLPLLGWLRLGGRCRFCRVPISAQYPIVEAACGLTFVLVFHLLFVQPSRAGLVTPELATDWPILLAWLVLAAAMLACAGMDIVSYTVDTRITDAAVVMGVVCYALWPRSEMLEPVAASPVAAAAVVAMLIGVARFRSYAKGFPEPPDEEPSGEPETAPPPSAPKVFRVLIVLTLVTVPVALLLFGALRAELIIGQSLPAAVGVFVLFAIMVGASSPHREADVEIEQAIEEESSGARGMVLSELLWLLPAILGAVAAYVLVAWVAPLGQFWNAAVSWSPAGGYVPVAGVAYALDGAFIGALAGWVVRIVFTLTFGREAFGTGDIFILAAAGACGGWDIALAGFVFAIGISLAAWLASLAIKRTMTVPFGPPLALGFVAALWANEPAARFAAYYREALVMTWERAPELVWMLAGVLLVGSVIAVVAARLLRRLIEPGEQGRRA